MSGLVTVHDQTNTPGTRHAHTLVFFFSLVFFPAVRLFMLPLAWLYRAAPWWLPLPFAAALSGSLRLWWLTHGQTDRQVWQTYWLEQGALLKQLLILFGAIVHRHLSGLDGTPLPQEVLPLGVFLHYGQAVWPAALSTAALLASLLDLWRRFRSRTDPAGSSLKGEDAVGAGKGKGTVPRADEGVHDASRGQEPGPRSWLVDGVIPDRYVSILYADGGVGKSMLAAYLGLCVTLGKDFLGWRVQQGKVLYIDGELDKHEWTRRLYMLSRGMGLVKPPRIYYYKLPGVFKEQWVRDRVRKRLTHCRPWWQFWPASKPVMVVFDSMTIAAGAGVAATDEIVTDLFKEWESWGIPVIAIDHITKPSSGDPRLARPFASQFKWNNARSIMLLLTPGKDAPPGVTLELFHRKTNFGTLFGSRYMTIMRDDQQMAYLPLLGANEQAQGQEQTWTASEPGSSHSRASVQEVTEPLLMLPPPASLDAFERVYEQVLLAGEGGVTAQEIAAVLGVKTKTVQNRLTALSKDGRVKTIRIGVYVVGNGK